VVERSLKGVTKEKLGREGFIKKIWEWKEKYGQEIVDQLKALGASCDWERIRFTLDAGLSQAVREVFVRLYEEGFIYRDKYIINWCPRCQTAISDIEVEHQEHEGMLYYIKYPLAGGFITVATTRPETMLGDTAVAVHPKDERYKGLIGKKAILPLMEREIPIIEDDRVNPEFGTGAVKVTPAHDPMDFEIGRRHGLEAINIFTENATMNENAGKYAGLDRYECRERVVEDLRKSGLLERTQRYVHQIGHCQRCHTIVEPRLSMQWFVRMKPLAEPAIQAVAQGKIKFIPKRWEKVYFDWMENIKDWCISRQLWWGHRIPAWYCRRCSLITVSRQTPRKCSKCSSDDIYQDEDVLDTWFSSALWPFSVMGWPQSTKEKELKYYYPTSLLVTGHDILFFWVARMIMMGLHFTGKIPFEKVFFHPMIRDEQGRPMSKSLGNVIDPIDIKERYGMDALRFALTASMVKGKEMRLPQKTIEGSRKFLNKLWNAARFCVRNLEGFKESFSIKELENELELEDRWILSKLTRSITSTRENLDNYDFNLAAEGLYSFVWHEFCDWYLEVIKPRLYKNVSKSKSKEIAQHVLLFVLQDILKLLHPFIPFITEEIWQKLSLGESVMIAQFPRPYRVDEEAEKQMKILQDLIVAIRNLRAEMNLPPQKKVKVLIQANSMIRKLIKEHAELFHELAGASEVECREEITRPKKTMCKVLEWAEVFIPLEGLIDIAKEKVRLLRELTKARENLDAVMRKLDSEEFLEKAPPEVIEKEKGKFEEFKAKVERLRKNLKSLGVRA
jgi:valyl-tRNA synthetase